jgi:phosphoglycolate phosphatase
MNVELICFDMAGTTVNDDGLVLATFRRTIVEMGLSGDEARDAESYVIETMGQSKLDVFTELFNDRAHDANEAFERNFVEAANDSGVTEVPGARAMTEYASGRGIGVALTTGFSPATREALIDLLGWNELFPWRVSPADAGRGRPHPDMVLLCALRAQVSGVQSIVVIGDTASDMMAGRRAGAGQCVGVLSGTDDAARLLQSGADLVVDSVADPRLHERLFEYAR